MFRASGATDMPLTFCRSGIMPFDDVVQVMY
jgi:hypothetical protein